MDYLVPEKNIIMIAIQRFRINIHESYGKNTRCKTGQGGEIEVDEVVLD